MKILSGLLLADKINKETAEEVKRRNLKLCLNVIYAGQNQASKKYIAKKADLASELGIDFKLWNISESSDPSEIIELINRLNRDKKSTGIIVQLPLPEKYETDFILEKIAPNKDVDGLCSVNLGKLIKNNSGLFPATPEGIIRLLRHYKIEISGKNVVIVGRSNLVGKPLAQMFVNEDATVTIANGKTKSLSDVTRKADILVSATGKPGIIKENMVKRGSVVIDVGTSFVNGKITGDVDFDEVSRKAGFITPVPGGVGPMTVAVLLSNLIKAHQLQGERVDG